MMSSTPVSSNAHTCRVNSRSARAGTSECPGAKPANGGRSARATPVARRIPKPSPATTAATRCPRIRSTRDSEDSTPMSITTKRNSIITAPV